MRPPETRNPATVATIARAGRKVLVSSNIIEPLRAMQALRIQARLRCTDSTAKLARLGRWKLTAAGPQRTGQVLELGAHRTADIARMISGVQRYLKLDGESRAR
jgi:hypothetical protein